MDSLAKTLTFVVIVVLVIPFTTIVTQYFKLHDSRLLIGPAAVVVILFIAFLFRPKEYQLDTRGLHIIRAIKPLHIPLEGVRTVMPITSKELGFGLRAFGSGGFFGYFGWFYYRNYGGIWVYATDRSKMLLITFADERKIIISPDDMPAFMKAFHEVVRK